ncbi:PQQ-binding-like beta-propeller repeat protein [Streptomyces sp. NPDC046712]|uniref:outer membrane protein assembly factor BamB family protein n=1 Tax=Streptomyces sp. NPDC046712 TaxID=3154802 RepID=UPI00340F0558
MRGRTAASTAAVLLSGAAFGAAAVLCAGVLGWDVAGGPAWPPLLAAAALTAAGAAGLARERRGRAVPEASEAVVVEDAVPDAWRKSAAARPKAPGASGRPGPAGAGAVKAWGPVGRTTEVRYAPDTTAAYAAARGAGDRSGRVRRNRPRVLVLIAVCLGLLAGLWGFWPTGEDATVRHPEAKGPAAPNPAAKPKVAWKVPAVGDRYDEGPGAWGLGDTLAQGRLDGLHAYDVRDGAVRWSVPAPAREALCAMSPDVEGNVGLIAYGRHEQPCATLVAVHTLTGKVLWRQPLKGTGLVLGALAVGGSTAVTAEEGAVRGRASESGEQRWERILGKDCAARAVDATAVRTLLVEQCGTGARLVALDTRTGTEQWTRVLPVESTTTAMVVSVAPVVVAVDEDDKRGTHALLGFDGRGAPTVTVPMAGPTGKLLAWSGGNRALVLGDLLVTKVETSSSVSEKVAAHSLKDGRKVWEYTSERTLIKALAREPDGSVGVLGNSRILLLDAATGAERADITPDVPEPVSIYPELFPVTGGHVVVNHISMSAEPAVFALR